MIDRASRFYRQMLVHLVDAVRRHALLAFLVLVAFTAAAAWYSVTHVAINTDTSDMLSAELEFRKQSRELSKAFPHFSDNLLVVLDGEAPDLVEDAATRLVAEMRSRPTIFRDIYYPPGDPYFRKNGLLYFDLDELSSLSDRLAEAQPFLGVLWHDPSLRGLFEMLGLAIDETLKSSSGTAAIDVAPVLDAVADVAEAQVGGRDKVLSWQRLMSGDVGEGQSRRVIVVQPALDFSTLDPAEQAMETLRDLGEKLGPGVRLRLTGTAALDQEELDSVGKGMGLAALISLVLVITLHLIGLRSARLALGTVTAMIFGLIWTSAFAFAAIGTLNLISVAFAVLFIGLSEDFGIHLALRYREEIDRGVAHPEALRIAVEADGGAITLCAVCAAIGFLSFVPTDYRGLAELGIIAGVGMFIAVLANMTVLPAIVSLLRIKRQAGSMARGPATKRTEGFIQRHGRVVALSCIALGLAATLFLPQARFDFDPLNLKDPTTESVQTLRDLVTDGRTSPYSSTILAADLEKADGLAEKLRQLPLVKEVVTLSSYVPADQDDKLAIIETMALFLAPSLSGEEVHIRPTPAERKAAYADLAPRLDRLAAHPQGGAGAEAARRLAAVMKRIGASDTDMAELERRLVALLPNRIKALRESLQAEPVSLADLPSEMKQRTVAADGRARVDVYPVEDLSDRAALKRFVEAVRAVAPGASGTPVTILAAGDAVVSAFVEATVVSIVLIVLLLAVLLRNVRDVALVFAPLLLAASLTVVVSVLLDRPLDFANVIVLPLLFGLGVANGIHYVARERDESNVEAVMATSTPRAVTLSALTTIGSFASMALSSHRGTAGMGVMLTVAIGLALVATLVFLPALMVWLRRPPIK